MPDLKDRFRAPTHRRRSVIAALALSSAAATVLAGSTAVTAASGLPARTAIADASGLVRLRGHVSGHARPQLDIGAAPDSLAMNGLEIVFAKTPSQERALEQLIAAQQDPKSPEYHKWLTPAAYGARFGASPATVAAVTQWLQGNGFTVDALPANRSQLRFHAAKAQLEAAFHVEIHLFDFGGVRHFSNVSDPEMPAALAPMIAAIHGLNDFYPRPALKSRPAHGVGAQPQITYDGGKTNYVGPGDFAVMYNLTPLYNARVDGAGVKIAVAEQSDIDQNVANTYWSGIGVASPPAVTSLPVPGGTDPGQTHDTNETEAYLDVEVAGALAPGASILLVRDQSAVNAFQYIIQQNLAPVLSISFTDCESDLGSLNTTIEKLFQEAAAQGMTVAVGSNDSGVAGCETNVGTQGTLATTGFAVNGLASTPYNLAVGGTDFDPTQPQDWGATNAAGTLANALAHIPEMVWNATCANPRYATALKTTPSAFCNQTTFNGQPNPFLEIEGSGGGVSSCLAVDATTKACTGGYPVPPWQSGVAGMANLTGRAIPDVAAIANEWVICSYDNNPCDPSTNSVDIVGGTSASTPAVAAIIALLDQQMGGSQGLVNPLLYQLAAAEYGTPAAPKASGANCSASLGTTIGADCVFYNVTAGSNAAPCTVASFSDTSSAPASTCNAQTGQPNGIMELSSAPQYAAGSGFSLASGLGSINATNLVLAIFLPPPSGLSATVAGQSVRLSWNAETHAASYDIYQASQSGQEGSAPVQSAVSGTSTTVSGLQPAQTYYFTIAAQAALGTSAQSGEVRATTVPAAPTGLTAAAGNASATLSWTAASGATGYNIYQGTSAGGEGATPVQSGVSGVTATVSSLTNGTTYFFTVAAIDAGGASAPSNEAQATPAPPSHGGGGLGVLELALLALLVACGFRPAPAPSARSPLCRWRPSGAPLPGLP
ncbi:MAG TPA: protease pro-enzyme activation domain-containing protein [Steroidobacteraceae bacterium]|nr:protease pro-enzyme activation domain-containing protein [Steroidobacteraceae bacterium]